MMEQHVPRHRRPPGRHLHDTDDQTWYVIAGRGEDDPVLAARYGITALGPETRWTPEP